MGTVDLEYCAPLDVCILRVDGDVSVPEIAAIMAEAAGAHPGARNLWDLTLAAFEPWTRERIGLLALHLRRVAAVDPGRRVALVAATPAGAAVCAEVQARIRAEGIELSVSHFHSRGPALEWLGVMDLPIGA